MELQKTLAECADSGEAIVVELPDQRLLAIRPLDAEEDDLIDQLMASNQRFRDLVKRSKDGPRRPFIARARD
jgi:hypothetical protein